jgi:hypothetical protein
MRTRGIALVAALLAGASLGTAGCELGAADEDDQQARRGLRLDPRNPHYLVFRGKPTVLITSGEHYGAVVNADFDYVRYLDELKRHGFNHTRVFSGTYIEPGAPTSASAPPHATLLGYDNTLAPRPGRFVSPWALDGSGSETRARFDLGRWNPAYFKRLKRFVTEASKRGVVVELVLFSALYGYDRWEASPFNARNNVNGVGAIEARQLYTLTDERLLDFQKALVRKLVWELRSFDNVYYEVMNEPSSEPAPASDRWQDHMIETIEKAESELPQRHLIARNYEHDQGPVRDPHPSVSIFNFHYERDPSPYRNLEGVISFDETGFQGTEDAPYRTDGWLFMLSGGGIYSNLDWSFTPDREDGGAELPPVTPGGGGPSLRRSLAVLKKFLERFDLPGMAPARGIVISAPPGATVRVLADHGRSYAVYILGGPPEPLTLDIAPGTYRAEWIDTRDGTVRRRQRLDHFGGPIALSPPPYDEDIALAIEAE